MEKFWRFLSVEGTLEVKEIMLSTNSIVLGLVDLLKSFIPFIPFISLTSIRTQGSAAMLVALGGWPVVRSS